MATPQVPTGASQMPNLPYELLVPSNEYERALAVIREARAAGPAAANRRGARAVGRPCSCQAGKPRGSR